MFIVADCAALMWNKKLDHKTLVFNFVYSIKQRKMNEHSKTKLLFKSIKVFILPVGR